MSESSTPTPEARRPPVIVSGIELVNLRPSTPEEIAEARDLHLEVIWSLIACAPFPTTEECLP